MWPVGNNDAEVAMDCIVASYYGDLPWFLPLYVATARFGHAATMRWRCFML